MDHRLVGELFHAAGQYHAAMAHYAAAIRVGENVETAAQDVVGASLRYRVALDELLEHEEQSSGEIVATRPRLQRMRRMLASASRHYNIVKRATGPRRGGQAADW